jgi:hypothetical protein
MVHLSDEDAAGHCSLLCKENYGMSDQRPKPPIVGQSRGLSDDEAAEIQEMIQDAQGSSRQRSIPRQDLDVAATTEMRPEVARVIAGSQIIPLLRFFNRDYLYNQGRFDEYSEGLLLKWGDGYSRKHIWVTVEGDTLVFETSHELSCGKPQCQEGRHVYLPDQWSQIDVINAELAEQFQRPVYERSDD